MRREAVLPARRRGGVRLQNFLLVVEDIERSWRFYRDLFGLEMVRDFDGNMVLTEGLVLQDRKIWETFLGKEVRVRGHDAELYFEEADLDRFLARVEKSGWEVEFVHLVVTHTWGQKVARLYDPDGHVIEVGEPFPAG